MGGLTPQIAFGRVIHHRLRPVHHGFGYGVFFVRVPLSQWRRAAGRWLSLERWNLLSLHRRDYGPRDGTELEPWIRGLLAGHGVTTADGEIVLQAFPRVLGYVFNPIAIWQCFDRAGQLRAVLCEVSNTFGERQNYLLAHPDGRAIRGGERLRAAKAFHVSPFCEVAGHYEFRFPGDGRHPAARIDYHDGEGLLLVTALHGRAHALTDRRALQAFLAYPWMTLGVVARIHWQALRLWLRRVPWFSKPEPPMKETTR
jgi:uncharacterized protein